MNLARKAALRSAECVCLPVASIALQELSMRDRYGSDKINGV